MGDIDGDQVLDLVVGAGKGHSPEVVVYSGAANGGKPAFETELARFMAFALKRTRRCQRGGDPDRRIDYRQYHRGIGTRRP